MNIKSSHQLEYKMRPVRHTSTFVRPNFPRLIAFVGAGRSPHTKKVTQRAIQQFNINPNKHCMPSIEISVAKELSELGKVWPAWSAYVDNLQTIGDLRIARQCTISGLRRSRTRG